VSAGTADPVRELRRTLGDASVRASAADILRFLRDNSWLSPVHAQSLERRSATGGLLLGVQAVVSPKTEAEVVQVAAIAARHRLPITPRGAGTSNFGLLTPEDGGIILDMREIAGEPAIAGQAARVPAGTIQGAIERAANASGRELPVMTTTYAQATAAGWIAGGHVGLGSGTWGSVWDGNVLGARVVTVEETPRILELHGAEATPLLHTFGAIGLVTEVTFRTVERRDWLEAVAFFPAFEHASAFVTEVSRDRMYRHRAARGVEGSGRPVRFAQSRPLAVRPEAGMKLERLDHVALEVADLDARIDRLCKTGGMRLLRRGFNKRSGERLAMVGDATGMKLELIENTTLSAPRFLHIAFRAGDLEGAQAALEANGWHKTRGPIELAEAQARSVLMNDEDGFELQLLAYAPTSPDIIEWEDEG